MYERRLKKLLLTVHPDKGYRSSRNREKLDIIYGALSSLRAEPSPQRQHLLYEEAMLKLRSLNEQAQWEKQAARAIMNEVLRRQRTVHETYWRGQSRGQSSGRESSRQSSGRESSRQSSGRESAPQPPWEPRERRDQRDPRWRVRTQQPKPWRVRTRAASPRTRRGRRMTTRYYDEAVPMNID
jgi:hypothetical protein